MISTALLESLDGSAQSQMNVHLSKTYIMVPGAAVTYTQQIPIRAVLCAISRQETTEVHIVLLRHGRSLADDEQKFEGRYDSPLTDVGRRQARERAQFWKDGGMKFDRIIAGPLARARETAQIIGDTLRVPVTEDQDWMEMDNGDLAGLTREEGRTRYPMPAFIGPFDRIVETGESAFQLHSRAMRAVERLMQNADGSYLVVSHGGIPNAAVRAILGIPMPVNRSGVSFGFRDLGFIDLCYDPTAHRWSIVRFEPGMQA